MIDNDIRPTQNILKPSFQQKVNRKNLQKKRFEYFDLIEFLVKGYLLHLNLFLICRLKDVCRNLFLKIRSNSTLAI